MASNLDRFKTDLDRLIALGESLTNSMNRIVYPEEFDQAVKNNYKDAKKEKAFLKSLPNFHTEYEAWYSESLAVLKQLLPDRVANFISFYEKPKARKEVLFGNYVVQDFLQGLTVTQGFDKKVVVSQAAAISQFGQQLAILKAARARFESSLFEIKQLVQADLFDSEIEAARELLKNKFLRAAGAIAGVVLEKHLRQVCDDHSIVITKKNPGISDLNELLKSNSVIDISQWRHISLLGDIRNLCDHNKSVEPTIEKVADLIDGADKVLKTIA